jgi:tetraacyldisaccharide 4'-kinase
MAAMAESFRQKIETIIRGENPAQTRVLRRILLALSRLYGAVVKMRAAGYRTGILRSRKLPCPVISIGNITVGGTGKTPLTMHVAKLVQRCGYRPVVISRGYGGKAEKTGGIVSDGRKMRMTAETSGDEPRMMASHLLEIKVPVLVGQNRFAVGLTAVKEFDPNVIILDDAFQHLKLVRDINLVLLDSQKPLGNHHLLPRGPLREAPSALNRGDAFVLTRSNQTSGAANPPLPAAVMDQIGGARPIFRTSHSPYIQCVIPGPANTAADTLTADANWLKDKKVLAFSGIAANEDFKRTVEGYGCTLCCFRGFADHYRYADSDIQSIINAAAKAGAQLLVTTEKDYVRIAHRTPLPVTLVVIGICLDFGEDQTAFREYLQRRLKELNGGRTDS